jgi:hypothetical protein
MPRSSPKPLPPALIAKIGSLPRRRIAEVEDFVDFLGAREAAAASRSLPSDASEPAFALVWSNPEDAVYDAV